MNTKPVASGFRERLKQWFGLLGAAIAWFAHLIIASVVGEGGCVLPGSLFVVFGIGAVGWLLILVSLAMLAIASLSTWVAWGYRRHDRESVHFMGHAGFIAGLIFLLVILAQTLPITTLLGDC